MQGIPADSACMFSLCTYLRLSLLVCLCLDVQHRHNHVNVYARIPVRVRLRFLFLCVNDDQLYHNYLSWPNTKASAAMHHDF